MITVYFQIELHSYHKKMADIYLQDDTLTLWKPAQDMKQYYLISGRIKSPDIYQILQTYYTKFDCVTSILTFDDAIPILANQSTTIKPTDDFSILRNYHTIQGLWFKPDIEERLSPDEESSLGNIKLSISLTKDVRESMFKKMNVYFLEILDYPAEDKSVSRILITKTNYNEFEKYDIHKPGGPIYIVESAENDDGDAQLEIYYLRTCLNFAGRRWRHEVEFMLEEDPWPMCRILPINNCCVRRPYIAPVRDVTVRLPCRYIGATWREALAGIFVWSLKSHVVWLVFERLHDTAKRALDSATSHVDLSEIVHIECPTVCKELFDTYSHLSTFTAKCENEHDLKDLLNIFLTIHKCGERQCTHVSLKTLNASLVLPGILFLLEKTIACASQHFRAEITSTILPWSIMGYYCSNLKINSHRKMVIFISQLPGIKTNLHSRQDMDDVFNGKTVGGENEFELSPRDFHERINRRRGYSSRSSVSSNGSVSEIFTSAL